MIFFLTNLVSAQESKLSMCDFVIKKITESGDEFKLRSMSTTKEHLFQFSDFVPEDSDYYLSILSINPNIIIKKNLNLEGFKNYTKYLDLPILKINSKNINDLTATEYEEEINKEKIEINFSDLEETLVSEKSTFKEYNVWIKLLIQNITNIDTRKLKFNTNFKLEKSWYDNRLIAISKTAHKKYLTDFDENYKNTQMRCQLPYNSIKNYIYIPKIDVLNQIDMKTKFGNVLMTYEPSEPPFVSLSQVNQYNAEVLQKYNLEDFPLDKQEIEIKIKSGGYVYLDNENNIRYDNLVVNDDSFKSMENILDKYTGEQWNFYDTLITQTQKVDDYYLSSEGYYMNTLPVTDHIYYVKRFSSYYIFKIVVPIIIILLISWSVFWINPKELESRITISIVCLLTLIAYNFVIDSDLPKLSYSTFMDNFILITYIFAAIPTIQSVFIANRYNDRMKQLEQTKYLFNNKKLNDKEYETLRLKFLYSNYKLDDKCKIAIPVLYVISILAIFTT